MKITGKLGKLDLTCLERATDIGAKIEARVGSSNLVGSESVKVYSDGFGDWHLFGGYCLQWAMIQARSLDTAHEIYLEEFVPCDEPDDEDDLEYGTFDGSGGWYSEVSLSYITLLNYSNYDEWDITITPGDDDE